MIEHLAKRMSEWWYWYIGRSDQQTILFYTEQKKIRLQNVAVFVVVVLLVVQYIFYS